MLKGGSFGFNGCATFLVTLNGLCFVTVFLYAPGSENCGVKNSTVCVNLSKFCFVTVFLSAPGSENCGVETPLYWIYCGVRTPLCGVHCGVANSAVMTPSSDCGERTPLCWGSPLCAGFD